MRDLILGGGGFLGLHLVRQLREQGRQLILLSRSFKFREALQESPELTLVPGDYLNSGILESVMSGVEIVYHLVSTTIPYSSNLDPVYDISTNVGGTIQLLQTCLERGVKRVVFISSGGTVYGLPKTVPITELHPTDPVSSYGISKLCVEKYLQLYHALYGLDFRILRLSNPYGEYQLPTGRQGVIAAFIDKALRDEPINIWGDGLTVRDYLHAEDAAKAIRLAADYEGPEKTFNIGSGSGMSLNQIVGEIEAVLQKKLKISYQPARRFDVPANILDIERARQHLSWSPQIAFAEGLRRTFSWLQTDPSARIKD